MSKPISNCPKCRTFAAVASHLHCPTSPTCTWNTCTACNTNYDRYVGTFTPAITGAKP